MPFGLSNAAKTFQRLIHEGCRGLENVYPYIDDILVASASPQEHETHLKELFSRLSQHGLTLNAAKCELGNESIEFQAHKICNSGITALPEKIQAIVDYPEPTTRKQVRQVCGLVNNHRKSIPNCADLLHPFTDFLRGKVEDFHFTAEAKEALRSLKVAIAKITSLEHHEPGAPLSLSTDASSSAVGATLQQQIQAVWRPLAFFSKRLQPAETRYSIFGRELLAVYLLIRHFRNMVEGRHFTVYTDHKPLINAVASSSDKYSSRETRHFDYIAQYTSDIRYVSGKSNAAADALSRVCAITGREQIDLSAMAEAQRSDPDRELITKAPSGRFRSVSIAGSTESILWDSATGTDRPFVPQNFRK